MRCPKCGAQNPERFRYCNQCGTYLEAGRPDNTPAEPKVKVRVCPNCGGLSPIDVWNCLNCGENLDVYSIHEVEAEMIKGLDEFDASKPLSERFKEPDKLPRNVKEAILSHMNQERLESETDVPLRDHQTRPSSHHYYALKGIASLCNGLAIVIVIIAIIGAIGSIIVFISAASEGDFLNLGLVGFGISVMIGATYHLLLRIVAEGIFIILDLERHSHQTAANTQDAIRLLKQLLQKELS